MKRLSKREATAIVAEALSKDGFIFKWHQTHQKGGISGERFAAYSMNVKNREDFFRESKTKFYVPKKPGGRLAGGFFGRKALTTLMR